MLYAKTQNEILSRIEAYLVHVDACFDHFFKSMNTYLDLNDPRGSEFLTTVELTHQAESQADDARLEFELYLYKAKKLLPHSRSDVVAILESFDRIPNTAETILFMLHCQDLKLIPKIKEDMRELVSINIEAYRLTRGLFTVFFSKPASVPEVLKSIDTCESVSDKKERGILIKLFDSDADIGLKLQIKELVLSIGTISDRCEVVGNHILVHSTKKIA